MNLGKVAHSRVGQMIAMIAQFALFVLTLLLIMTTLVIIGGI